MAGSSSDASCSNAQPSTSKSIQDDTRESPRTPRQQAAGSSLSARGDTPQASTSSGFPSLLQSVRAGSRAPSSTSTATALHASAASSSAASTAPSSPTPSSSLALPPLESKQLDSGRHRSASAKSVRRVKSSQQLPTRAGVSSSAASSSSGVEGRRTAVGEDDDDARSVRSVASSVSTSKTRRSVSSTAAGSGRTSAMSANARGKLPARGLSTTSSIIGGADDAHWEPTPDGNEILQQTAALLERVSYDDAYGHVNDDEGDQTSDEGDGASVVSATSACTPGEDGNSRSGTSHAGQQHQPDPRDMLREQLRKSVATTQQHHRGNHGGQGVKSSADAVVAEEAGDVREISPRRYYILSTAGKLVYSNDPDEERATGFVGVMQAIVSIYANESDRLRYIDAGQLKVAFMLKPPLYLVASSDWGEPEATLRQHLEYLHLKVLSMATLAQLEAIFAKRPNFDLRLLLDGSDADKVGFSGAAEGNRSETDHVLDHLVLELQSSLTIMTACLEVYRCDISVREECARVLLRQRPKEMLYAMIVQDERILTLVRPRAHSAHPSDLHLLLSIVQGVPAKAEGDGGGATWVQMCLPRFNARGFLYACIASLSPRASIIAVTADRDGFKDAREWVHATCKHLKDRGVLKRLADAPRARYSVGELGVPSLRHFVYKHKAAVQITAPAWEGEYEDADGEARARLVTLYQRAHSALHHVRPARLVYLRSEHEAVLGWSTGTFELYVTVSELLPIAAVVGAARAVVKWVKSDEGRLFLVGAPTF